MCGIAGYCGPAHRFSDGKLATMLRAIEHRGPDDCGVCSAEISGSPESRVWLGSRRLAIQDLSPAGHQPMADPATGNVIVFNGEIYNFRELRRKLRQAGDRFRSQCDTEVALRSWSLYGLRAVDQWRGMFGAAVWEPVRRELWLVRDPWGIKPLYYRWDGEGLAFCSEIRGLLAADEAPPRLSRRGLEDYLRFGALQDPVTIIDGVYALLPGHALRWSGGKIQIVRYPEPEVEAECSERDVEPMLREIVQQQLISDAPVVVLLSGGVDSSVVSLLARQEAGAGVHTMSVVFDEDLCSEGQYARRVAAHIGAKHHEVRLHGAGAQVKAAEAVSCMDQPTIGGVSTYVICEAARREGFTVALSGLGGDEFFGGYPSFRRMAGLRTLQRMAQRAPRLAVLAGRAISRWKGAAASELRRYIEDGNFAEHPYFSQRTLFFPRQVEKLCLAGQRSVEAERLADSRRAAVLGEAEALDPLNQVSLLEARTYMANTLLRDSDQMSMAHSIELRVPLVDHLLAAALLATPGRRKGFGRAQKLWLRQAFGLYLPEEVFTRKKMGFTLPFAEWLKGPWRQHVEETLGRGAGDLWEPKAAGEVWEGFLKGQLHWSRPWALYVLSRWVTENIHGEGSVRASGLAASSP